MDSPRRLLILSSFLPAHSIFQSGPTAPIIKRSAFVLPGLLIVIETEEPPGRLYNRTFLIAVLSQMGFVLGNTLMTHYGRWIEHLGGDAAEVGWVMGLGAASAVICRPWLGQLINRLGPRTTWAIGYVLFAIGVIPNMLVSDGLLDQGVGFSLYLFRACMALGAAFIFTSSLTYVTHLAPRQRRTELIGILGIAGFIGMMIGPFVGDILLDRPDRNRGDFVILFISAAGAIVIPLLLLLLLPRPEKARVEQSGGLIQFVRLCRRHWPGPIVLVCLAFGFCMTVPFVFLPTFVDKAGIQLGNWSTIGVFFWVYSGWGIFLRIVLRRLPERIGHHNMLYAGLAAMVLAMVMYYRIDPEQPWTFLLAAWMGGTGHGLLFHTTVSLTIDAFPSEVRGTGTALATMFVDLGMVGGPPVLGIIAKQTGYQEMFLVIGLVVALIAIFYACWRRFGGHHVRSASPSNG